MFGLAIGNGRRANAAAQAAYVGAQRMDEAAAYIRNMKGEMAELKSQAQIDAATIAGHIAQINALKAENPDSPILQPTGKFYKISGNPKSRLRLVFEQTFDAALSKIGIVSPEAFRLD
jgi:hypothetical protein